MYERYNVQLSMEAITFFIINIIVFGLYKHMHLAKTRIIGSKTSSVCSSKGAQKELKKLSLILQY